MASSLLFASLWAGFGTLPPIARAVSLEFSFLVLSTLTPLAAVTAASLTTPTTTAADTTATTTADYTTATTTAATAATTASAAATAAPTTSPATVAPRCTAGAALRCTAFVGGPGVGPSAADRLADGGFLGVVLRVGLTVLLIARARDVL